MTYDSAGRLTMVQTAAPTFGAADVVRLGIGNSIILGGAGADSITAAAGNDIVLGDNGALSYAAGLLTSVQATTPTSGGNDGITLAAGNQIVIGGVGTDTITTGTGNSMVFGDDGSLTYTTGTLSLAQTSDPGFGSADVINLGTGNNTIFGGAGANTIAAANGNNIVLGNNGTIGYVAGAVSTIASTNVVGATGYGANNTITLGAGNQTVIAGIGADSITGGTGNSLVIGDEGSVTYDSAGRLTMVQTISAAYGAADTIRLGIGNNIALGGAGADSITAGAGNDIVLGDNGSVAYTAGVVTTVQSAMPTSGGNDAITLAAGNQIVIGGVGSDTITTGAGSSVIYGDDASMTFVAGQIATAATLDPSFIGNDTITAGAGRTTVNGGGGTDKITVGTGGVIVKTATTKWQMEAAAPPTDHGAPAPLTKDQLAPVVEEAKAIWQLALGPKAAELAFLNGITIDIGQLPEGMIGATQGSLITIDATAAGWGWNYDTSTAAYRTTVHPGVLMAVQDQHAASEMDLLSTVLHEMGNAMGFAEDHGEDVTGDTIAAGTRRLPTITWDSPHEESADLTAAPHDTPAWLGNFLDNLGQDSTNPTLRIRIKASR